MSKLYSARSLLYRRQNLQENIRWKALDEIYKIYTIYTLLHRSNLNISEFFRKTFFAFFGNFFLQNLIIVIELCSDFDENSSEFRQIIVENV